MKEATWIKIIAKEGYWVCFLSLWSILINHITILSKMSQIFIIYCNSYTLLSYLGMYIYRLIHSVLDSIANSCSFYFSIWKRKLQIFNVHIYNITRNLSLWNLPFNLFFFFNFLSKDSWSNSMVLFCLWFFFFFNIGNLMFNLNSSTSGLTQFQHKNRATNDFFQTASSFHPMTEHFFLCRTVSR